MSSSSNVVIILDVNSIPKEVTHSNNNGLLNSDKNLESNSEQNETNLDVVSYQYEIVRGIKETVIALLCKEAVDRRTGGFNFSRVQWSFKFYNSSLELNSKPGRTFHPVDIDSIDLFEKQLESYLEPTCQSAQKSNVQINRVNLLSTAIKSVLGDLPWPDSSNGFDDDKARITGISSGTGSRNMIHALFRVPRTDREIEDFMHGWSPAAGSKSIMNELLPKAFCKKMKDQQIQLNFTDMWSAFEGENSDSQATIDGVTSSRPMLKIVHYLSGGSIFPFSKFGQGIPLGLPSYGSLLKICISQASNNSPAVTNNTTNKATLDHNKKTIQKLHSSINGSAKVSPEDIDTHSIRSSIRDSRTTMTLPKQQRAGGRNGLSRAALFRSREDIWQAYNGGGGSSSKMYPDSERDYLRKHRNGNMHEDMIPKKRKYEFEDDMGSEEGYSQREIENWCMKGKVDMGEMSMPPKPKGLPRRGQHYERESDHRSRRHTMHVNREREVHDERRGYSSKLGRHTNNRYSSPQLLQPQKRVRREDEEMMAPPMRISLNKQRHSDPSGYNNQKSENISGYGSRARAMLSEGLKMLTSKSKEEKEKEHGVYTDKHQERMLQRKEQNLNTLMTRLQLLFQKPRTSDPISEMCSNISLFKDMVLTENETCLASAAQALVTQLGKRLAELKVRDLRKSMERILIVPFEQLNISVIQRKNSENEEAAFRECQLQILIQFEMYWAVPNSENKDSDGIFVEDVIKILNLIIAYRKHPPIEDFINDVLAPTYAVTHRRLLREIAEAINIVPSPLFNNSLDSPVANSHYPDDCSLSSAGSSLCNPEDSTSQHPHEVSYNLNHSQNSQRTSMRTASFLSVNNPKRAIMMPASKLAKPKSHFKSQLSQSTQSGSVRPNPKSPKPKRVRRNLFDVQASRDPKDMKLLLNMATNSANSFTRSPSLFKSPASKLSCSPHSPARTSPFFTLARASRGKSRRRLVMEPDHESHSPIPPRIAPLDSWGRLDGSPGVLSDGVICPESPNTPQSKGKHSTPGSRNSIGTSGKSVVQESPEMSKTGHMTYPLNRRVDSVSFYSAGTDSLKARAWERSGAKLMAARIKDSVDMSSSLTMNDFDFIGDPPNGNNFERKNSSINYDDNNSNKSSPLPCTSKSLAPQVFPNEFDGEQRGEVSSSNLEALICSEILSSPSEIVNLSMLGSNANTRSPNLDTPSKKVQFNLEGNLINTPSPGRNSIFGTPRSILKEQGNTPT